MMKTNVNAKKYVPTPYDLERQLELLAPPSTPPMVRVPLLGADDPVPGSSRRTEPGIGGTGELLVRGGFAGSLRVEGEVAWTCGHAHRSREGAVACAWQARGIVRTEETAMKVKRKPPMKVKRKPPPERHELTVAYQAGGWDHDGHIDPCGQVRRRSVPWASEIRGASYRCETTLTRERAAVLVWRVTWIEGEKTCSVYYCDEHVPADLRAAART